jgi:type I restriction enzyme R subunit
VERFWDEDTPWLETELVGPPEPGKILPFPGPAELEAMPLAAEDLTEYRSVARFKRDFWQIALDHYSLFGIDDLESARTYGAPQFVDRFGSFQTLSKLYGGPQRLKADLEQVKQHLYVTMAC